MRKILIIGIGAGNPDYVTIQAINAMNQADMFLHSRQGGREGRIAAAPDGDVRTLHHAHDVTG